MHGPQHQLQTTVGGVLAIASVVPSGVVFALIGLGIGVACLQTYVFTIATCIYLNYAINLHEIETTKYG